MPIPQNILNLFGIVPLFQGIFAILALWNEHGILKGGSISLFHTRWFKKIEEFFQKVHETLKKYLKDPIVLEIAIYSFYSQAGTASTYVYVFSALSLNSMLMLCGLMMAFTFVKTILVWFIFHQIKLNLIHTLMIPTDIVPEKLTFYVYPLLLTLTGFCMLGQSFLGPYLPKFV
jgi:cadmium resistance protein CadD (predicted permease)